MPFCLLICYTYVCRRARARPQTISELIALKTDTASIALQPGVAFANQVKGWRDYMRAEAALAKALIYQACGCVNC